MAKSNEPDHPVIDWDDMSEEDRARTHELLQELNEMFDKYTERDDGCEDSILSD
jgi:hypothetical protein